ncbi:hypothetical protein GOBAR_AA21069 [Gossypium barbadense]|uniref:60S acidic ribosomal protein P2 n=1 Tax=Gossypium barbadense TaxID=3634 RepID=A0A2P5X8C7_GOSBA|nr:hypothetical protein GOBAR_AA21069 [Gossypium barbadense]
MKVVAAYLLAVLGGNLSPSADDLKDILGSVGAEADDDRIELLLSEVKGKDITELIASGREKLASVPSGLPGTWFTDKKYQYSHGNSESTIIKGEGVGMRGFGRGAMSGRSERGRIRVGGRARTSIAIYGGVGSGGEAWASEIINQVFEARR